ncbi:MAG: nucleotidyltransferase family protein [Bacteroidaceae bacterium]|nr:nucleotidyltransferase family protein [Bacteroidaceae bacterium]
MERVWADQLEHWQQAFLELLRSGLWNQEPECRVFPLSPAEWQQIYDEACRQTVQGIVHAAVQKLPPDLVPPWTLTVQWTSDVARLISTHRLMCSTAAQTQQLLRQAGLEPLLQKGLAAGSFYERPELRANGDIDWYIASDADFPQIQEFLQSRGYDSELRPDGSLCFEHSGIIVELHRHLVDLYSPRGREAVEALARAEGPSQIALPGPVSVANPGPAMTLLMLIAHPLKHLCSVGIGLRQFCDLACACHALRGRFDVRTLHTAIHHAALERWCRLLGLFLIEMLALPADAWPWPTDAEDGKLHSDLRRLLHDVLTHGNFGLHTPARPSPLHTMSQMLRRLPFSLRYAPRETASYATTLFRNRINK